MLAVNYTTARNKLKELCDKVSDQDETVIVTRKGGKNVVILSAQRYNELERAEKNFMFLEKIEHGIGQIRAGEGVVKTFEELRAMAEKAEGK